MNKLINATLMFINTNPYFYVFIYFFSVSLMLITVFLVGITLITMMLATTTIIITII